MLILDALFALVLYKLFGVNALYILGITACVSFIRGWGKVTFVFGVYQEAIYKKLAEQQEVQEDENL